MPKTCCKSVVFRERVNIQRDTSADGEPCPEYDANVAKGVPCNITTISGDETFRGRQLEAHLSHVVEMWYRKGLKPTMRLVVTTGIHKDAVLNIQAVRPEQENGRPAMLTLYCRELPEAR